MWIDHKVNKNERNIFKFQIIKSIVKSRKEQEITRLKEENLILRASRSETVNSSAEGSTNKQQVPRIPWSHKELLRLAYCCKEYNKKGKAEMWTQALKRHPTWFVGRSAKSLANKYLQNKDKEAFNQLVILLYYYFKSIITILIHLFIMYFSIKAIKRVEFRGNQQYKLTFFVQMLNNIYKLDIMYIFHLVKLNKIDSCVIKTFTWVLLPACSKENQENTKHTTREEFE